MWSPWISELYGIKPWEMDRVNDVEYVAMVADLEQKNER